MICEYFIAPFRYIWFINTEEAVTKKVHPFPPHWVEVFYIYIISGLLIQCQWQTSLPNKT